VTDDQHRVRLVERLAEQYPPTGPAIDDTERYAALTATAHALHAELTSTPQGPGADEGRADDAIAALQLVVDERGRLDQFERWLIEAARDAGKSWEWLGLALGRGSGQAAQQRYQRIGGQRTWPTPRPAPPRTKTPDPQKPCPRRPTPTLH
jgi:hypothetical protein